MITTRQPVRVMFAWGHCLLCAQAIVAEVPGLGQHSLSVSPRQRSSLSDVYGEPSREVTMVSRRDTASGHDCRLQTCYSPHHTRGLASWKD